MSETRQLLEYYKRLSDDDLARLALTADLTPEAQGVITQELQSRGITDLSSFKRTMEEDAVLTNPTRYAEVTHKMALQWKQSIAVAGLVACGWLAAAGLPFGILTLVQSQPLGSKLQTIGTLGALIVLSVYLGLRARREGRRLAFYLRAVVTLVLLCVSTALVLAAG